MAADPYEEPAHVSNPVKRIRWATQRLTGRAGSNKRQSILRRLSHRTSNREKNRESTLGSGGDTEDKHTDAVEDKSEARTIYFNRPLPEQAKDERGHPRVRFVRNKIRTARYTPISFVPKNLYFQFHNVANIYFLFIIILSIFSIFGASNPGLNAAPLIVILFITAVKDAIEDWRRTVLDNELNNSPVHRLVDWHNVNVADDDINVWRRFKKFCSKGIGVLWRLWSDRRRNKREKGKGYVERAMDEERPSIETRRQSIITQRTSFHTVRTHAESGAIQMTPVPSPKPSPGKAGEISGLEEIPPLDQTRSPLEKPAGAKLPVPPKIYGSILDKNRPTPENCKFKKEYWKNVRVGDFVRLYDGEQVPADIVVLSTSDPDGACYVETKNLDGETNLKVRQALHCGRTVKHAKDCEKTDFVIESEPPHANLYAYSGVARWQQCDVKVAEGGRKDMAEPITINNMLLRGCSVQNTDWVLGVVVFTGEETKIMLNSGITPSKRAKISRDLNWNVIYNFIILFCMCLVAGIVQGVTWGRGDQSLDYFEFGSYGGSPALDGFITFWSAIILFQNLVPISLYISLEIIRTAQAFFIYSDTFMYYEPVDYPCTPKSWNISDDLGQIEYIFSDKTGTLTQNVMEFKKATIAGCPYGEAYTEAQAGMQRRRGVNVEEEGARAREQIARDKIKMLDHLRKLHPNPYLLDDNLTFIAPDFVADLNGESGKEQRLANENFMIALALCHTVMIERIPGDPPKIAFKAQSPDEAALVATARDCGFTVLGHQNDDIILNALGTEKRYTVLNTLEFNSTRKRMSAIVRTPEGKIILYCKGADSVIYSRLRKGEQSELRRQTAEHLEMFAREGLRTLCIAQRELDEKEYQAWNIRHDAAAAAVSGREEKLEEVSDIIERDLTLLGGTAIEDRLQDGVPDAIALLGKAGIKLWVLTGDKVETAINIGFSCNLLDNSMDLILLNVEEQTLASAEALLDKNLSTFGLVGSNEELKAARKNHEPPASTHALIIDGESLKLVLDESLRQKFLLLCKQCKSVLCCRVSPAQKAAVVEMVKRGLDVMTLSIGDGANDVAMIQEADVGVGIAGEEGRQAVMSSDYAIGQFRFLTRLVLVHGRWSYRRLAETIANFFYKNIVWTFALFWYQIYDNFDCQYMFDYTYILLYNLAFTSLPVILMGILDQDVDDKVSLAVPQLYRRGIERLEWTQLKFWTYMVDGVYQSLICFFMTYLVFAPGRFVTESGHLVNDAKRMGVYVANGAIVVVNTYILLNTYRWDWLIVLITAISILLIWFWTGVYTATETSFDFYQAAPQVYQQLSFWCLTLLTIVICLLPRFSAKAYQKMFRPRDIDIIREQIRQGKFDYLKEVDPDKLVAPPPTTAEEPSSSSSSDMLERKSAANGSTSHNTKNAFSDEHRPSTYPPSTAAATSQANLHLPAHASSNHEMTSDLEAPNRSSLEVPSRASLDRPRPSFDRMRASMDRTRASYLASSDFTSADLLQRVESSHSQGNQSPSHSPASMTRRPWPGGFTGLGRERTPTPSGLREATER